jgi:hypothetical protein
MKDMQRVKSSHEGRGNGIEYGRRGGRGRGRGRGGGYGGSGGPSHRVGSGGRGRGKGQASDATYHRRMGIDPWQNLQGILWKQGVISSEDAHSNFSHVGIHVAATDTSSTGALEYADANSMAVAVDLEDDGGAESGAEEDAETEAEADAHEAVDAPSDIEASVFPLHLLTCGISLKLIGNSISVDLTGSIPAITASGITCDHSSIHASILWRGGGFSDYELKAAVAFRKQWLLSRGREAASERGGSCTFDVSKPWGRGSNFIRGELLEFISEARAALAPQLHCDPTCGGRPPHVSLRAH